MAFSLKEEKWDQLLKLEEDPTPPKTSRFMSLSLAMHSLLAITAALLATPLIETPEQTFVEFEISESALSGSDLVEQGSALPVKTLSKSVKSSPTQKLSLQNSAHKGLIEPAPLETPSFEELESAVLSSSTSNANLTLDDNDFEEALKSASSGSQSVEQTAQEFQQETESFLKESASALSEVEESTDSHLKSLAASRAENRAQEAAAIQKLRESESSLVEKTRSLGGSGLGNQESGDGQALKPTGPIRKLEQLRQMPGNKRPQYSIEERKLGHAGTVVFQAYVTKEGRLKNLRQIRSTGFSNLDLKASRALKDWRFYPGQEGWVELPFHWNLAGEVKALGGGLRIKK